MQKYYLDSSRPQRALAESVDISMFSPENLKRLAALSREEDLDANAPKIDARARLEDNGNIVIPIELEAAQLNLKLDASAKLELKLNVDIEALDEARKIRSRNDRIKKMRELFQVEAPVCQLVIGRKQT